MNIHGAMRDVRGLLEERGILPNPDLPQRDTQRVALVAPALAMRRAALTFEKEGLQVIAWPTNLYGSSSPTGDTLAKLSDLVPSVEALRPHQSLLERSADLVLLLFAGLATGL
jgi:uncharacterized SAM-binding protein YcdF (DUF218 family)